jgi:hypothetical protein
MHACTGREKDKQAADLVRRECQEGLLLCAFEEGYQVRSDPNGDLELREQQACARGGDIGGCLIGGPHTLKRGGAVPLESLSVSV